jgi:hypothetical protein
VTDPSLIGADTDRLRREAFQSFVDQMTEAKQALVGGVGPPRPVPPRAQIDTIVNQFLPPSWDTVQDIMQGFVELPNGDADRVHQLAQLLTNVEDQNTETAAHGFGDPTASGHH